MEEAAGEPSQIARDEALQAQQAQRSQREQSRRTAATLQEPSSTTTEASTPDPSFTGSLKRKLNVEAQLEQIQGAGTTLQEPSLNSPGSPTSTHPFMALIKRTLNAREQRDRNQRLRNAVVGFNIGQPDPNQSHAQPRAGPGNNGAAQTPTPPRNDLFASMQHISQDQLAHMLLSGPASNSPVQPTNPPETMGQASLCSSKTMLRTPLNHH